jgi:uncharacterized membrane protein YtjA (UPF0391 family)
VRLSSAAFILMIDDCRLTPAFWPARVGQKTPSARAWCWVSFAVRKVNGKREASMLRWAAIFLVIAIIAALFGFTGIAEGAADIARFLFFLFIAIFVVIFLLAIFSGKKMF